MGDAGLQKPPWLGRIAEPSQPECATHRRQRLEKEGMRRRERRMQG